jgi:flavin reductase (DIM6/NTAB) family NADH-FMN oxidoreductase RutF
LFIEKEKGMSITEQPNQAANVPLHKYFASTVALITTHSGEQSNVMTCEWTMNVCYRPLRIMSLIKKDDLTHAFIMDSHEFGVNICSDQQSQIAHFAGNTSGYSTDKLAHPLFRDKLTSPSRIKAPMIKGCILSAECVVEQTIDIHEYTAFIGRAVAVRLNAKEKPLIYHKGRFAHFGSWISKPTEENEPNG